MSESSILNSIKKMLGIDEAYDAFDTDIQIHINSVFSVLEQIGATPPGGFFITGVDETWESYLKDVSQARMVKTYMYLKVRAIFDPPSVASVLAAYDRQASELEWRLGIMEYIFDPSAQLPNEGDDESVDLGGIREQISEIEEDVKDLDEEIDEVPDLVAVFNENRH